MHSGVVHPYRVSGVTPVEPSEESPSDAAVVARMLLAIGGLRVLVAVVEGQLLVREVALAAAMLAVGSVVGSRRLTTYMTRARRRRGRRSSRRRYPR
jgi:hypothetical protein